MKNLPIARTISNLIFSQIKSSILEHSLSNSHLNRPTSANQNFAAGQRLQTTHRIAARSQDTSDVVVGGVVWNVDLVTSGEHIVAVNIRTTTANTTPVEVVL